MIANREYLSVKGELLKIKAFIMEKYFSDRRGYEIRKFLWCSKMLKNSETGIIGKLPQGMIREIAEYI